MGEWEEEEKTKNKEKLEITAYIWKKRENNEEEEELTHNERKLTIKFAWQSSKMKCKIEKRRRVMCLYKFSSSEYHVLLLGFIRPSNN